MLNKPTIENIIKKEINNKNISCFYKVFIDDDLLETIDEEVIFEDYEEYKDFLDSNFDFKLCFKGRKYIYCPYEIYLDEEEKQDYRILLKYKHIESVKTILEKMEKKMIDRAEQEEKKNIDNKRLELELLNKKEQERRKFYIDLGIQPEFGKILDKLAIYLPIDEKEKLFDYIKNNNIIIEK